MGRFLDSVVAGALRPAAVAPRATLAPAPLSPLPPELPPELPREVELAPSAPRAAVEDGAARPPIASMRIAPAGGDSGHAGPTPGHPSVPAASPTTGVVVGREREPSSPRRAALADVGASAAPIASSRAPMRAPVPVRSGVPASTAHPPASASPAPVTSRAITWSYEPDPAPESKLANVSAHLREGIAQLRAEAARARDDQATRALSRAWVDDGGAPAARDGRAPQAQVDDGGAPAARDGRAPQAPIGGSDLAIRSRRPVAPPPASTAAVDATDASTSTLLPADAGARRATAAEPAPSGLQIDHLDIQIIADPEPRAPAARVQPGSGAWAASARRFVRRL